MNSSASYVCLIFSCCLLAFTQAAWEKDAIQKVLSECNATAEDAAPLLTKFTAPDTPTGKCLMLCTFKWYNMTDSQDKYDEVKGYKVFYENWKELDESKVRKVHDVCVAQDKALPAETLNCERGYQMMKCLIDEVVKDKFYEESKKILAQNKLTST